MEVTKTCNTCGATESQHWYSGPICIRCYDRARNKTPERRRQNIARKQKYYQTDKGLFRHHVQSCKRRDISNELSSEEFLLKRGSCFYCSAPPPKYGSGLDRIDNSKGYTLDNVIACCPKCNYLRQELLTVNETKALIELLKQLRKVDTNSPWSNNESS